MNFVIPMAGHGQRFKKAGYHLPKMLITAHGKTLLEWSINSLPLELCTNLVCVLLKEHEEQYKLSDTVRQIYKDKFDIRFHFLENVTRGQAETVLMAKPLVDLKKDLVIFNIDTYFHSPTLAASLTRSDVDGVLGSFESTDPRFSFAVPDSRTGLITKTAEKEAISNHALTGLYHFKDPADFFHTAEEHIKRNIRVNNEFYIAPMYNDLIKKGRMFVLDRADTHFILGTPEELEIFLQAKPILD